MVSSRRNGNDKVRSRGKPQKVHAKPNSRSTNANRIMKNSDASLPRTNTLHAQAIQKRPRRSETAGKLKVRSRLSQEMYRASGGRSMPCDQAGSFHQSRAI